MVKLKRSQRNLELGINVAKTGNSAFFFRGKQQIPLLQTANSAAWRENPRAAEYCWPALLKRT